MTPHEAVAEIVQTLERNQNGNVKGTANNYLRVLRNDPLLAGNLKYHLLTTQIDVVKTLQWNDGICPLTDADIDYLFIYLERNYSLSNDKMMNRALRGEAHSNKYHPIRDYLNGLQWDGTPRVWYMLKKYLGADTSDLTYECLLHSMLGQLRRYLNRDVSMRKCSALSAHRVSGNQPFSGFWQLRANGFPKI